MKKADILLLEILSYPNIVNPIQQELYSIIDRYNDNKGYQSTRTNVERMEKEIDRLIDKIEAVEYGC